MRRKFVKLARYARDLEENVGSASQAGPSAPKTMTPEQLAAAVEKLRKAANSGIRKQMGVSGSHICRQCRLTRCIINISGKFRVRLVLPSGYMTGCAPIRLSLGPSWDWTVRPNSRCTRYLSLTSIDCLDKSKLLSGQCLPQPAPALFLTLATDRYDYLSITGSHVNVRWSDSGEFKFSGTYGK